MRDFYLVTRFFFACGAQRIQDFKLAEKPSETVINDAALAALVRGNVCGTPAAVA